MADILEKIGAYKRAEIVAAKLARPLDAVERDAKAASPPRGFLRAIERRLKAGDYALIAEIKKASPSKGLIRDDSIRRHWRRLMKRAAPPASRS